MIYSDEAHTNIIQPIRIKSAGSDPLYEICLDEDKASSPTSARNLTYEGKTLKAVFSVATVKMETNVPDSSDNYGYILTTSSSPTAREFMASKNIMSFKKSYNGGLSSYKTYAAYHSQGSYIHPSSILNESSSTWYVVMTALNPSGFGGSYLQMGVFRNLDAPNLIPSTNPVRIAFNDPVDGFPCRTATTRFTCAPGKGFMTPGVNWGNPRGVWFGNILIGISI